MKRSSKWLIGFGAALALLFAADFAGSLVVRSRPVSRAITARLRAAFGRPVEVGGYGFSLWQGPRIEADSITVAEDPRFGNEYFLRAVSLTVGLRWRSLLRGRVEFGSFSLSQPSLNVVTVGGRWNLTDWLPPASPGGSGDGARVETPRLYRIEIHNGRIDFNRGVDKLPFALVDVEGSVDERAPGRWTLSLAAQPMRVAVNLQDAGTLHLAGEVGGTTARLRPARLDLRWDNASLSDVLRLGFGYDYGVRGSQNLDLRASSNGGQWQFRLVARETGLHSWYFAAEPSDPGVNVRLAGIWSPGEGKLVISSGGISAAASRVALTGQLAWPISGDSSAVRAGHTPALALAMQTSGVGFSDLLNWYRAFHSGVSPSLQATGWISGTMNLGGWPPRISAAALDASGFRLSGGGLAEPVTLAAAHLGLSGAKASLALSRLDFGSHAGVFAISAQAQHVRAWRYALTASGDSPHLGALVMALDRLGASPPGFWHEFGGNGALHLDSTGVLHPWQNRVRARLDLRDAVWEEKSLPARARLSQASVEWDPSRLKIEIARASALGAHWRGWLERTPPEGPWRFQLAASELNARSLAARLSPVPRRPSLLERIFGFGHAAGSPPLWPASLDASGSLRVARLLAPPLEFRDLRGELSIHHGALALSGAHASFYGGSGRGALALAVRKDVPVWQLDASFAGVNLAKMSQAMEGARGRFAGFAAAKVSLAARGATSASLLDSLSGSANVSIRQASDRQVDWLATLDAGHAVRGRSVFSQLSAAVHLAAGKLTFHDLRLVGPRQSLVASGTLDLAHGAALAGQARLSSRSIASSGRVYEITGSAAKPASRPTPSPAATKSRKR